MGDLADLFLTPASILVGALGVARTEGLKTGVSVLGILTSALWFWAYCHEGVLQWTSPIGLLPVLFFLAWVVSAWIHAAKFLAEKKAIPGSTPLDQEVSALSSGEAAGILRAHVALRMALK